MLAGEENVPMRKKLMIVATTSALAVAGVAVWG
jgi:hypothetical protein